MSNLMLAPAPYFTALDTNGDAVAGALIYTLSAGGVWPGNALATYTDSAGLVLNANPIVADAAGRATIFGLPTSYKFIICTAAGVVVKTQDNIIFPSAYDANVDIPGTAGENLAAGDAVYLADGTGGTTAGRWYKTDADAVASSSGAGVVGAVPAAIASGASGSIRIQGRVDGFVGLTPGADYFVSAVAGGVTATAPTNRRFVGVADLSTSLVVQPTNSETAALVAGAFSVTGQTQHDLLQASSASQWARIAGAASSVLVTDSSKVPSLSQTLPAAVQANITALGTIASHIAFAAATPAPTTSKLYSPDGLALWFNGAQLATGSSVSGTAGTIGKFTGAAAIGNSLITESGSIISIAATLALAANNLTMTGSLGATAARLTKAWLLDLEVTNAITGSITGNAATVTNATLTTALTNNGGAGTLTWPGAGATLTIPTGGGILGTAAFTAATAYEVAGAAATVQGNLNTHAGLTTTAHGLGASAFHADSYFSLVAGSSSIVTVGTITSGIWNAGAVTSSGTIQTTAGDLTATRASGNHVKVTLVQTGVKTWNLTNLATSGNLQIDDGTTGFLQLSTAGLFTVSGFGTHTFSAGGTGAQILEVRNTGTGTGDYARLAISHSAGSGTTSAGAIDFYSTGWTTAGWQVQDGMAIISGRAGGMSIGALNASGAIRFYSGGTTERWRFETTGHFLPAAADTYNIGSATYYVRDIFMSPTFSGTGTNLLLTSGKQIALDSSSERTKRDIAPWTGGVEALLGLQPIEFLYRDTPEAGRVIGLSAERVYDVLPQAVNLDDRGRPMSLRSNALIAALWAVAKHDHARIAKLEAEIATLQAA